MIVSAAAGSGKTAVLARRCAYLVCDAPRDVRCEVDQLLVLTFTDASAAEMRGRIVDAIREAAEKNPDDARLREQVVLVDAARISTVHSFCRWVAHRWFHKVGLDPMATLLDGQEAELLRCEVIDDLLGRHYEAARDPQHPLGRPDGAAGGSTADSSGVDSTASKSGSVTNAASDALVRLIDVYGLGDDRSVTAFVRRLNEFTTSLPNPDAWLCAAHDSLIDEPQRLVADMIGELSSALLRQAEECDQVAERLVAGPEGGHFIAEQIREHGNQLRDWLGRIDLQSEAKRVVERFATVQPDIAGYAFSKKQGPRLAKDADEEDRAARKAATADRTRIKDLFERGIRKPFTLFSVKECLDGLTATAPYVATIVELVRSFRTAYAEKKRALGAIDFSDLERMAFDLLCCDGNLDKPSDVARALQDKFAHVLVDEFQDINPIQQAIIQLVSRECDADRDDNLFVVGDVKQSIYRFRLAEPALFTQRLERLGCDQSGGEAISLQMNFRSQATILEAVNLLFAELMRSDAGRIVYDDAARLQPGREENLDARAESVEVHLLERNWNAADDDHADEPEGDDDRIDDGLADPERWSPIDREAYRIGTRIQELVANHQSLVNGNPLAYRDIAVLLRAKRVNAERIANVLTALGVPAFADVSGSLLAAREVRDVLAALDVLDNMQQDIPLAAVLRSGTFGAPLTADDLAEIRLSDRSIPFHAAVRTMARAEAEGALSERLRVVLERIDRYRTDVRRRPLAEVIGHLYEREGFLAYVGGLPGGAHRRANLFKLHELARRFGSFRRQGLHRFLRYVESLAEQQQDVAVAPAVGEAEDVVRIMSIHQSKGLEFPVVFIAGLGNRLNLGDRRGRMIFERTAKIGLRVVDTEKMIEFPSVAHTLAACEVERATREEELRVLYVAMTRAKEKLILVGSMKGVASTDESSPPPPHRAPPPTNLRIVSASCPLDWIIPVLAAAPDGLVNELNQPRSGGALFDVYRYGVDRMAEWRLTEQGDEHEADVRRAVARCLPLPPREVGDSGDDVVARVCSRIDFVYPYLSAASVRASVAASEFKGRYDFMPEGDAGVSVTASNSEPKRRALSSPWNPDAAEETGHLDREGAARRGVITHRVLEHLDFTIAVDTEGLVLALDRLVAAGVISVDDRELLDGSALGWFLSTPLAERIRSAGDAYRREFMFIATEPVDVFDRDVTAASDDRVLVRGVVDGILPTDGKIEIIDFKTDVVRGPDVARRFERYRPQMAMYAHAVGRLWRCRVRTCWIVFLSPREVVPWHDPVDSLD